MVKQKIYIVAGGTGGHVIPAIELANSLIKKDFNIHFFSDKRTAYLHKKDQYKIIVLSIVSLRRKLIPLLYFIFSLVPTTLSIIYNFIVKRPKLVIIFGGYVCAPVAVIAYIFRVPIIIHEQNIVLGRTNKVIGRWAKYILSAYPKDKMLHLSNLKSKVVYVGSYVRSEFINSDKNSETRDNSNISIAVFGGSQGAKSLSMQIASALKEWSSSTKQKLNIYHQVPKALINETTKVWQNSNITYVVKNFFDNSSEVIKNADIIIARAGATSIAEFNAAGKVVIYVPYKLAMDDHQLQNACYQVNNEAGFLVQEDKNMYINIQKYINMIVADDKIQQKISYNAKTLYRQDSLKQTLRLIKNCINKSKDNDSI